MKTSDVGLALITEFEGLMLDAYPDPASGGDPWTIGVGHTKGVHPGMKITREQAMDFLREDVADAERGVNRLVKVPLSQHQFDALVSFTFNLGEGNLSQSTLLKLLNSGQYNSVGAQFLRWNRGPKGPMPGLTRRREAEKKLFETGAFP